MDQEDSTQTLTLAQQRARFDLWVKEDRIPNIQRKHHWKTWLRAIGMTEQEQRVVNKLIE